MLSITMKEIRETSTTGKKSIQVSHVMIMGNLHYFLSLYSKQAKYRWIKMKIINCNLGQ